jgi:hypothetical protein
MLTKLWVARAWAVALCVCSLASVLTTRPVGAKHDGGGIHRRPRVRVGQPVSYKNLTLFPVIDEGAAHGVAADAYVTLDEGIRSGTVEITERSAGPGLSASTPHGRRPANRQVSYRGDGATVNELSLVNRSGKKLLLLAGEVIVGGKQDRIVQDDLVVPPVSTPISLSVFCVEHGRWSQSTGHTRSYAGAAPVIAPLSQERKAENFYSLGAVAHPTLRAAAQDKKSQGDVWKEVGENNARLGTKNTTDTYRQVYAGGKVGAGLENYFNALRHQVAGPNVVGVVVARNGVVVWADVFAAPSLFARYWPKLLKSYAVEALADPASDKRPPLEWASHYLFAREGRRKPPAAPASTTSSASRTLPTPCSSCGTPRSRAPCACITTR